MWQSKNWHGKCELLGACQQTEVSPKKSWKVKVKVKKGEHLKAAKRWALTWQVWVVWSLLGDWGVLDLWPTAVAAADNSNLLLRSSNALLLSFALCISRLCLVRCNIINCTAVQRKVEAEIWIDNSNLLLRSSLHCYCPLHFVGISLQCRDFIQQRNMNRH